MSYLDWKVGDKIVCIDAQPRLTDRFPYRARTKPCLKKGQTYTIRAVTIDVEGSPGVLLEETKSVLAPLKDGTERAFFADRFRPVHKRNTDISIFTALLNPTEQDKEEIELADFILEHAPMQEQFR